VAAQAGPKKRIETAGCFYCWCPPRGGPGGGGGGGGVGFYFFLFFFENPPPPPAPTAKKGGGWGGAPPPPILGVGFFSWEIFFTKKLFCPPARGFLVDKLTRPEPISLVLTHC